MKELEYYNLMILEISKEIQRIKDGMITQKDYDRLKGSLMYAITRRDIYRDLIQDLKEA